MVPAAFFTFVKLFPTALMAWWVVLAPWAAEGTMVASHGLVLAVLSDETVTRGEPVPVAPLPIKGVTPLIWATLVDWLALSAPMMAVPAGSGASSGNHGRGGGAANGDGGGAGDCCEGCDPAFDKSTGFCLEYALEGGGDGGEIASGVAVDERSASKCDPCGAVDGGLQGKGSSVDSGDLDGKGTGGTHINLYGGVSGGDAGRDKVLGGDVAACRGNGGLCGERLGAEIRVGERFGG